MLSMLVSRLATRAFLSCVTFPIFRAFSEILGQIGTVQDQLGHIRTNQLSTTRCSSCRRQSDWKFRQEPRIIVYYKFRTILVDHKMSQFSKTSPVHPRVTNTLPRTKPNEPINHSQVHLSRHHHHATKQPTTVTATPPESSCIVVVIQTIRNDARKPFE